MFLRSLARAVLGRRRARPVQCLRYAVPVAMCAAKKRARDALDGFTLARDGFCVIRGALDAQTICALQHDLASRGADGTICQELASLDAEDLARTDEAAYLQLRDLDSPTEQSVATCLFSTLPGCAAAATGWGEPGRWCLMQEHFVAKSASSDAQHFLWHRDAERHLWAADGVAAPALLQPPELSDETSAAAPEGSLYRGPPVTANAPYVSLWTVLDPTTRDNGTLVVLPARTRGHRDAGRPAARPCDLERCEAQHGVPLDCNPTPHVLKAAIHLLEAVTPCGGGCNPAPQELQP
jgi:hypothetical protein